MHQTELDLQYKMINGLWSEQLTLDFPLSNPTNLWSPQDITSVGVSDDELTLTASFVVHSGAGVTFYDDDPSFIKRLLFKILGFQWK